MSNNKNNKQQGQKPKPGSVDEAAKALRNSQQGGTPGEDQGGAKSEDQGGEKKPGEEQPQPGQESSSGGEGQAPGAEGGVQQGAGTEGQGAEGGNLGSENGGTPGEDQGGGGPKMKDISEEEEPEEIPTPVPGDAECERFAKQLAKSPAHLDAFRKTIAMADAIIIELNKGPRKTIAELETENYKRLVGIYGPDFVTAKRGTNRGYFSRKTWNAMKVKRGWEEVTKVMPEVAAPEATEEVKA